MKYILKIKLQKVTPIFLYELRKCEKFNFVFFIVVLLAKILGLSNDLHTNLFHFYTHIMRTICQVFTCNANPSPTNTKRDKSCPKTINLTRKQKIQKYCRIFCSGHPV